MIYRELRALAIKCETIEIVEDRSLRVYIFYFKHKDQREGFIERINKRQLVHLVDDVNERVRHYVVVEIGDIEEE